MSKPVKGKPPKRKALAPAPKRKTATRKAVQKLVGGGKRRGPKPPLSPAVALEMRDGATAAVLDRLFDTVTARRDADPNLSHSARLLSRGRLKVAQKFGEEAVECLIEAVAGNGDKLISESADMLYHLIVMWVDAGLRPEMIWTELQRRQGVSGIAEKASRSGSRAGDAAVREPGR